MDQITAFRTLDGKIHSSQKDAKNHLEKKLGDILLPLAHRLVNAEKYSKIVDLLNAETETLRAIVHLQDDFALDASED